MLKRRSTPNGSPPRAGDDNPCIFEGSTPMAGGRNRFHIRRREFLRDRVAIGTVEFAMIAPLLLFLLLAGFDIGRFVLATQRTQAVANSVAEMLSQTDVSSSAQTPGDGVVYANDLLFYWNSAMFTFPDALASAMQQNMNWWNLLNVNMASIKFVGTPANCTTNCTAITPKVVWTLGQRSCGSTITAAPDTSTYSATTLPTDVFPTSLSTTTTSLIVVDVFYTWKPTIGANYLPSIPIQRSVFMAPRNVPLVESVASTAAGTAVVCS
jgi:hypothetical protein